MRVCAPSQVLQCHSVGGENRQPDYYRKLVAPSHHPRYNGRLITDCRETIVNEVVDESKISASILNIDPPFKEVRKRKKRLAMASTNLWKM